MKTAAKNNRIGSFVTSTVAGERVRAYVPPPLPPRPGVDLAALYPRIDKAMQALGRLDGIARLLPDTGLFLYLYVRKEALLSSQIEGTQSSLSDLLLYENEAVPGVPLDDVREVSHYVAAMDHGLERLRGGFPLSLRLLREIHGILLQGGRGADKEPGEFRRTQNWIGGTRPGNATYVPPPPERVTECMGALETFLHDEAAPLPVLVKAGLAHVQFESIHPFLDGNGRLGRLLVAFLLTAEGALAEPILYLSLYLKAHRSRYYALLQAVREEGAWEAWLAFFLEGVEETATQAAEAAAAILDLFRRDRARIAGLGRPASSALRVHDYLQHHPILSVPRAAGALALSGPTVRKSVRHLADLGILTETTRRRRDRLYVYGDYLAILNEGTEPLRRG